MDISAEIKRVSETYGIPVEKLDEEWIRILSISVDVRMASETHGIPIERLDEERAKILKEDCIRKYINTKNIHYYWDGMVDMSVITDPNGWELIPNFIQDKSCLLFFWEHADRDMFVIRNGKDLCTILNETNGDDIYITDFETSFLICFNHHDVLSGCGKAKPWVDFLIRLKEEEKYRQILRTFHDEVPYTERKGISIEIKKVAETLGISVKSLETECMKAVKAECMQKYIENKEVDFWWEGLRNPNVLIDSMGGIWFPDFIKDRGCLMFFDNDADMLVIKSDRDLFTLVTEMPVFEFYITDYDTTFLLCCNHHNGIFGCGTAKPWVDHIREIGKYFDRELFER